MFLVVFFFNLFYLNFHYFITALSLFPKPFCLSKSFSLVYSSNNENIYVQFRKKYFLASFPKWKFPRLHFPTTCRVCSGPTGATLNFVSSMKMRRSIDNTTNKHIVPATCHTLSHCHCHTATCHTLSHSHTHFMSPHNKHCDYNFENEIKFPVWNLLPWHK